MKRKIFYISGTRADYGVMRSVLSEIRNDRTFDLTIVATGMHCMDKYGSTIDEILKDGFSVHRCTSIFKDDSPASMARFIGSFIIELSGYLQKNRPDILLLTGDRGEMLAAAVAATYLQIPIAHIAGGDITSTVDEHARHAITKLSHIHFPATGKHARRIRDMGENPDHIHIVGSPGIEAILSEKRHGSDRIAMKYSLNRKKPIILVAQHPVSKEYRDAGEQMHQTLEAIAELGHQTIISYPNADAGNEEIIRIITRYGHLPFVHIYKNIPHEDYLDLLGIASVLVGNSSSGIIEAPSFKLPVVNIGTRQQGRDRAANVLDVPCEKQSIRDAIIKALTDVSFLAIVKKSKNPYGDPRTSRKIVNILKETALDEDLVQKTYFEREHCNRKQSLREITEACNSNETIR